MSDECQAKVITIFPGGALSLQEHKKREEHWVVVKGSGKVVLGESIINIYPGKYIYIPKGCRHQMINNTKQNIIFSEIQLGDYFGEDDIIRYQDKYNRI
jgi:mannose-1-phosphate guanylyltransferase/mannose-6-phosphate isomerase